MDELDALLAPLNEAERVFAERYVSLPYSRRCTLECFDYAWPNSTAMESSRKVYARKTYNKPEVQAYIRYLQRERTKRTVANVDEIRESLTQISRDLDDYLADLPVSLVPVFRETSGEREMIGQVPRYVIADPSLFPTNLYRYVKDFSFSPDLGVYVVNLRESEMTKDRLKAMEMLGKSQGMFQDRIEVTGGMNNRNVNIGTDLSANEAAELYKSALNGSDE